MKSADEQQRAQIDQEWAALSVEAQNEILDGNLSARQLARAPDRGYWLRVGCAMSRMRTEALRASHANNDHDPRYRRHFRLLRARVPDLDELINQDNASTQHARWMFENWPAIESWLAELSQAQPQVAARLNHPSTIKRRFEADSKTKPQGLQKVATPLQRAESRIAELTAERDELDAELRRVKRGRDDLTEGRDWTWQDSAEDIASAWMRLRPTKAPQVASRVLEMSKTTRTAARKSRAAKRPAMEV